VLTNPEITRHRFTPFQWALLDARNPRDEYGHFTEGRNSSVAVGRILQITGHAKEARKAERQAERIAYRLYYLWTRANYRWHLWKQGKGPRPSREDFRELALHRRSKKGRKVVQPYRVTVLHEDVFSFPPERGMVVRFSEMYDSERCREGIGEEYGSGSDE
jgi:hypothetical protein